MKLEQGLSSIDKPNRIILGLHHYFPHRMKQDYIVNLLLGLQLGYHRYRLDNRCLYDGVDSEI